MEAEQPRPLPGRLFTVFATSESVNLLVKLGETLANWQLLCTVSPVYHGITVIDIPLI
jgi:hypothetical protein